MFGGGTVGYSSRVRPDDRSISRSSLSMLLTWQAALELYPSMMAQVSTIGVEAGWAQGDDGNTTDTVEGNALPFSPAYNLDNLLFKHVIPTAIRHRGKRNKRYLRQGVREHET